MQRAALVIGAFALAAPAVAQGGGQARWEAEARGLLAPCAAAAPAIAERVCAAEQAGFVEDYVQALAGSFPALRNTAYMLAPSVGALPAADPRRLVRADPVQGCAWWLVAIGSGDASGTSSDARNARTACDRLPAEEQAMARARAVRIRGDIDAARLGGG